MSSNLEEQEMEAQALEAIFDQQFHYNINSEEEKGVGNNNTYQWMIEIFPEQIITTEDSNTSSDDNSSMNHVGCKLLIHLPSNYPESQLPLFDIELIKGLAEEHRIELLQLANDEATVNEGMPCIYAVAERIREWLVENNVTGLDDISMHAIMLRKEKEKLVLQQRQQQQQQNNNVLSSSINATVRSFVRSFVPVCVCVFVYYCLYGTL
jgi:RWD domain